MDRIQKQASNLWELIFSDETAETYQAALNLTGNILTDTARLIWLVICSVFVFGAWLSDASVKAGNNIRTWLDQQTSGNAASGESKPIAEKGKDVLESSRTSISKLLNKAREELGLEAEPLPTTETALAKTTPSEIAPAKMTETLPVPSAAPAAPSAASTDPSAAPTASSATSAPMETSTPKTTMVTDTSTEDVTEATAEDAHSETEDQSWPPHADDD